MSKPVIIGLYHHVRSAALWVFSMVAPFLLLFGQEDSVGRLVVEGSDCAMMGDFASSQSQTVRFQLRNAGIVPIGIKAISKSCGCADAEASTNQVEAGARVEVTMRTLPDKLVGSFSKSFYVITTSSDPQFRAVQLTLIGRGIEVPAGDQGKPGPVEPLRPAATPAPKAETGMPSPQSVAAEAASPPDAPLLSVEFFVQEGCAECLLLRREFLPAFAARYGYRLRPVVSDTHDRATFLRLLDTLEACGVTANEPLYMVVDGKTVLAGWREVERRGFEVIDQALSGRGAAMPGTAEGEAHAAEPPAAEEHAAARLFRRFGWTAVAAAGLADGLNPCAFATIVFLTSLLATGGRRGRAVFVGGLAFCLASFLTYFLIGLGLLSALRRLEGLGSVRAFVEWGTIAALAVLGALSLLDAWRYGRTGDAHAVRLQLSDGVKQRIRRFAIARWSGPAVFGTGLVCGAGVTVLESVCTGQMYLPTLVFMSREGGGCRAWSLLILYNVLFVVPLFIVFVVGAVGVRSQRLAGWTRRHVVPSKLLLAAVFFALAMFLLANTVGAN